MGSKKSKVIAYFDCFSGISGDMTLGALVDAGVPLTSLKKELSRLPVKGYELRSRKVTRAGMAATKVDVVLQKSKGAKQAAKKWSHIQRIIDQSTLSSQLKEKGLFIFKRLFQAEADVHGSALADVHLHELGAIDCVVDILGSLIGIDLLGISAVYASPLNLGTGTITSSHGTMPVPAPASVHLLKGVPVYSSDVAFELTTPTGAAIISSLASDFGPMPMMTVSSVGAGAGDRKIKSRPNIMRLMIGEECSDAKIGDITVLETNIDDMNPQVYEYVMEKLFRAGALDVFMTQILMKKNRPAILLSVLTDNDLRDSLADIILRETSSIGVRYYQTRRRTLHRETETAETGFGKVRIKKMSLGDDLQRTSLEYDDCRKIAKKYNIPLLEIMKTLSRDID